MLRYDRPPKNYRGNRLVTAPAFEPVDLEDLKQHLRYTEDDQDAHLRSLIEESREQLEEYAGMAFINQTWRMTLDDWTNYYDTWWDGARVGATTELHSHGTRSIHLQKFPLVSVDTVTTYNEAGTANPITIADVFDIDLNSFPGRLSLKSGQTWPVASRPTNAVEIVYTAGYGTTASVVPSPIRQAIRNLAAYYFEHRGDECTPTDALLKSGSMEIMRKYTLARI